MNPAGVSTLGTRSKAYSARRITFGMRKNVEDMTVVYCGFDPRLISPALLEPLGIMRRVLDGEGTTIVLVEAGLNGAHKI